MTRHQWFAWLILLVALLRAGATSAQDDVPKTDAAPPAATAPDAAPAQQSAGADASGESELIGPKKPPGNLWEMIVAGGPLNLAFMGFLALISLVAAAVALERLANVTRAKLVPPALAGELEQLARSGEHRADKYEALIASSTTPLANVWRAALLRVGRPLSEVEKAMEDGAARELAELRSRSRPLSVAANVAPMVGLLGTVVGMLEAFRVASQAGLGKAELLAEGIYLALETTVAGLLIAIPALLLASFISSRGERLMRELADHLTRVLPVFVKLEERRATGAPRTASDNPLLSSRS
jgi:biopolymer transport protein ExbB